MSEGDYTESEQRLLEQYALLKDIKVIMVACEALYRSIRVELKACSLSRAAHVACA